MFVVMVVMLSVVVVLLLLLFMPMLRCFVCMLQSSLVYMSSLLSTLLLQVVYSVVVDVDNVDAIVVVCDVAYFGVVCCIVVGWFG